MLLEFVSRMQFGFTISFHILFPAFSIGLITFIALLEGMWIKTRDPHYRTICKFWTKILALTFGMGIVSGIVMEFQLGTNWSKFTNEAGSVLGALFTYEVLTAFFIEAGFLGVLFFGWERVSPKLHFAATLLALAGVTLSAFWIMSANSWMQTPAGALFDGHIFTVNHWFDVIFNPSFVPRFIHMLLATYIASLLVISAVSAFYLLKKRHLPFAKTCFSWALWALLILVPLQIVIGDRVGLMVHEYQPIKTAAIEAVWDTEKGAPLVLFAWPDQKDEKNYFALEVPKLGAYLNTHELDGELIGLKSVAPTDRPPVPIVFFSFRIMVGLGILMLLTALVGLYLRIKKTLYDTKWFLRACLWMAPIGFISIITGWFTAEFGRQPWIIYHYMRTLDAHSPIELYQVLITFASLIIVYGIIFGYFYFHYFLKTIFLGPQETSIDPESQAFFYMSPPIGKLETQKKEGPSHD